MLGDVDAVSRPRMKRLRTGDRDGLALRVDRRRVPVLDRTVGRAPRRLADEHAVHGGRRLEPRSRVHDVAGDHRLPRLRPRREQHEGLAGVDGDPHIEALLDQGVPDREGSAHRALGIVLVGGGCAEDGHHRVADELLDLAAEALELGARAGVVRREQRPHILRVRRLRTQRVADQVDEDDADSST